MPIQPAAKVDNDLSDATIPASDTYQPDEDAPEDEIYLHAGAAQPILSSPPLMQSSPPVPRRIRLRDDTPPLLVRFACSSHMRAFASMDDSGYISSLSSSAIRAAPDRPVAHGRAEEAIVRMRDSSDSPSRQGNLDLSWAPTSSPLRPLIAAVKLTVPTRPPPSASPTANLRLHRERIRALVASPARDPVHAADECLPLSPAFNFNEPLFQTSIPSL